ncbi:hypothetical protein CsSME_00037103 [Camellia sinensis var. sinensis]
MDSSSMLILDSQLDRDKLPKSFILIQTEIFPCSKTLVPYPLISNSGIIVDNLGLAEITSASRPGHVAPQLILQHHVGHVLLEQLTSSPWNNMLFMMYYGVVVEVRTAVYAGMCALPPREQLLLKLNENGQRLEGARIAKWVLILCAIKRWVSLFFSWKDHIEQEISLGFQGEEKRIFVSLVPVMESALGGSEECGSSESGWTMYIASPIHGDSNYEYDDYDDLGTDKKGDDNNDDASSGPSHPELPYGSTKGSRVLGHFKLEDQSKGSTGKKPYKKGKKTFEKRMTKAEKEVPGNNAKVSERRAQSMPKSLVGRLNQEM